MKKIFISSISALFILLVFVSVNFSACTKDAITINTKDTIRITVKDTVCIPNIQGLWEGTFTSVSGYAQNGKDYYFSLSVYNNGTCSYKSGTDINNNFIYAAGTWTLVGTNFSFTMQTLNTPGGIPVTVNGSATFNKNAATLSNGTTNTITPNTTGTWRMNKVN